MSDTASLPPTSDPVVEDSDRRSLADGSGAFDRDAEEAHPPSDNGSVRGPHFAAPVRPNRPHGAAPASVAVAASASEEQQAAATLPADAERELFSYFGLRHRDQLVVATLVSAMLVFSGLYWASLSGWGTRPIEIDRPPDRQYAYQLDPNTANWVEWMQLPEIGETLARRIVEDRDEHGPYRTIEDLQRVRGIGPKTVERIRPWLREPSAEPAPAAQVP